MATTVESTTLVPDITSRLGKLRWVIRSYVWLQGIAVCIVCLAVGFWLSLAIDWIFEPSPAGRAIVLGLIGLAALYVIYRWLVRRLIVPLTNRNMAVLLERRHRQLGDRLLTVVELSRRRPDEAGFSPDMLGSTRAEVLGLMPQTEVVPVMDYRPLAKAVGLAILLVASVVAFAMWRNDAMGIWWNRSVLLGERQWPRATKITVEGFPVRDGLRLVKVAKGSGLTVRAQADTKLAIPDSLQIRYETEDGITGRPNMTKLKKAVPGRDPFQLYEYQFKNIQSTIVFDVVAVHGGVLGKNDRVNGLVIQAVDSPDLTDIALECKYPEYLNLPDEQFEVRLVKPLPEGTEVTIIAGANKDLEWAKYQRVLDDPDVPWETAAIDNDDEDQPRRFRLVLGALQADTRVVFQLHDLDGVSNQQPIRLLIRIVPDEMPRVEVQLVGIGKAVTPVADLPVRGTIWDDHGLSRTWFDYRVDGADPAIRLFPLPPGGELDEEQDVLFQLAELGLQPGQQLSLTVKAADNYGLTEKPHEGVGQRYDLQVVSEGELRALLETRERILRRRFEGIIAEMDRTRDSLSRLVETGEEPPASDDASEEASEETDAEEPSDDSPAESSARASSRRILRTEQAIQASDRMQNETSEVAQEFERILLELENNNVTYIEELQRRLGDGIITPLHKIADTQFSVLDDLLGQLRRALDDDDRRPNAALATRRQVDVILRSMDQVLQNMLELQKFNELLADLRKIIDAQKQISELTEEERARLRQRLKDELKKGLLE